MAKFLEVIKSGWSRLWHNLNRDKKSALAGGVIGMVVGMLISVRVLVVLGCVSAILLAWWWYQDIKKAREAEKVEDD